MRRMIFLPHMPNVHMTRGHRQRQGRGMGSVLLNQGGAGSASSYESVDDYMETTGRQLGSGLGLGIKSGVDRSGLNRKLESLSVAPKKTKAKNIHFNL
jgi:hypothetical protein